MKLWGWIEELGDDGVRQPAGQLRVLVPRKRPERSGRYLALEERLRIADLRLAGTGVDAVAAEIGRSASTVSRELRRNGPGPGPHNKKYAPYDAQKRAEASGCSSPGRSSGGHRDAAGASAQVTDVGPRTELARHSEITLATEMSIFFCDPHSPWQRGSNENTNGLLRQYFPKGTDLSVHSSGRLIEVAAELNARPRKTLGMKTPADMMQQLLFGPLAPTVATTA